MVLLISASSTSDATDLSGRRHACGTAPAAGPTRWSADGFWQHPAPFHQRRVSHAV